MRVSVYTDCVQCNQTKRLMDREGIDYQVFNLAELPAKGAEFEGARARTSSGVLADKSTAEASKPFRLRTRFTGPKFGSTGTLTRILAPTRRSSATSKGHRAPPPSFVRPARLHLLPRRAASNGAPASLQGRDRASWHICASLQGGRRGGAKDHCG